MKQIILDGKNIDNEIEIHNIIAKYLDVPNYYGKNIYALWDILSTYTERPFSIKWINANVSRKKLGKGFDVILKCF